MAAGKYLLLGDIDVDTTWPIDEFPVPGRDGLVDDVQNEAGGATLNSAVVLDRFGLDAALIGCMGDDLWAEFVRTSLAKTSIDLSHVQIDSSANTGLDVIFIMPDGERTIFGYRGSNKLLQPQHIKPQVIQEAAVLHLSGYAFLESPQRDAAWQAVRYAREFNVPVSVDTGLEPVLKNKQDFLDLLPALEICITGLEEMAFLLGAESAEDAANKLVENGVGYAVIKLGSGGSYFAAAKEQLFCPVFNVAVKDTTGAGDSFSAGVLYGWGEGLQLGATAVLASALGALATTVSGAGLALPKKSDLIAFLENVPQFDDEKLQDGLIEVLANLKR